MVPTIVKKVQPKRNLQFKDHILKVSLHDYLALALSSFMVKQVHNQLLAVTICVAPLTCYLSISLLLPSFFRSFAKAKPFSFYFAFQFIAVWRRNLIPLFGFFFLYILFHVAGLERNSCGCGAADPRIKGRKRRNIK